MEVWPGIEVSSIDGKSLRTLMLTAGKLVQRIREEFEEMPGLQVTVDEGVRFWALDTETCSHVLEHLYDAGFLVKTGDGRYHMRRGVRS